MKEIVDFVSLFDAQYPKKIRGAKVEEIAQLERLAARKLPAGYREFLQYMGKGMGGVGLATVDFSIETMADFHRNASEYNWPARFLIIAEHGQDPFYHYFLDLDTLRDGGDCRVVSFDSNLNSETLQERHLHEQAPSMREFLIHTAFLCKGLGRFPHQERAVFVYPKLRERGDESAESLARFERSALNLGFRKITASALPHLMLGRDDAALYAKAGLPGMVAVTLMGRDEHELLRIREILSDQAALG